MDMTRIDSPTARSALLVDGENLSVAEAGRVLLLAGKSGWPIVRRTYGHAARIPGWALAPGFSFVQTGTHKNAADLALCVEAMDLFHSGFEKFFVASSDSDFSFLAITLREKGATVIGIGEAKAPESFRKACSAFVELAEKVVTPASISTRPQTIEDKIVAIVTAHKGAMEITELNVRMKHDHAFLITSVPEKTWRAYLTARPHLFICGPKSTTAQVRLKVG